MTQEEIYRLIEEEDVEFIRLQFTDMFGNLKNMAVTPSQLGRVFAGKYCFAGATMYAKETNCEEDFYLRPDPDTFVILPWRPQQGKVAKIICDVYTEDGEPVEVSPRYILKKVLKEAKEKGYTFMIDPECEFFLFHTDENGLPTTITHEMAGYMDVGPVDFGENARRDIVLMLEDMGYEIESSFHENAVAQHEIDFKGAEASKIADYIMTFRFAVRSIAKRFGLYATFMAKPKTDEAGSSLHLKISAYKNGMNVFAPDENGISKAAKGFMGGVLAHESGLCAVTNPTVNSYKRLLTGYEAPSTASWSEKGEKAAVKLINNGADTKIELRVPDASCNPYLAIALSIAAGIEGMEKEADPGLDINKGGDVAKCEALPENLSVATTALLEDELLTGILGKQFVDVYSSAKYSEWKEYIIQISNWEISRYLIKM